MLVVLDDVIFGYGTRPVVRVEKLHLHRGRCLGIFGPNGAGKTTLVRGITGLLRPMSGQVRCNPPPGGSDRNSDRDLRFGYLPQHRAMELHWPMTAFDAACMAVSARQRFGWPGKATHQVREAMQQLDVASLSHERFARLSGGQQQRVLLAGALATRPHILVLDEPTDGLDVRSRSALVALLREQNRLGLSTALISHEVEDLLALSDDIAWLHPGNEAGEPSSVELIRPSVFAERVTHVADKNDGTECLS